MYFRDKKIKGSRILQLVESYRNPEGRPRQRIIASLGDVHIPEGSRKIIAQTVEDKLKMQLTLLAPTLSEFEARWVDRIVPIAQRSKSVRPNENVEVVDGVEIDSIEMENVVQLGPELVALKAWDELNLTTILREAQLSESMIDLAKIVVINRLVEPLSEWALIDWSVRSALPEILDTRVTKTGKDRLYRLSDQLRKRRKEIEFALRHHEESLFHLDRTIVLYDVTNTHFEGVCASNPKAKHGANKQKRNDCKQVAVGVAFDADGFALAHEVFPGNMADTKTLETLLDRLAEKDANQGLRQVVVLDAGFASKENIEKVTERGYAYIINMNRHQRKKYAAQFSQETFVPLPGRDAEDLVEVKRVVDPDDANSFLILCRSAQRRAKEQAIISKAEERLMKDAEKLKKLLHDGRLKKTEVIDRRIGALLKKHPRVARYYRVRRETSAGVSRLKIERKEVELDEALSLCGDYVLKTDQSLDAATLWRLYMTLLKAERGFKMLKGTLGLRPNFHQKEDRVDGHIFISILAYHLLSWIDWRLRQAGDTREWRTIRRLLRTHSLASVRLPLRDGRVLTIRKACRPDCEQERVYRLLEVDWKRAVAVTKTEIQR